MSRTRNAIIKCRSLRVGIAGYITHISRMILKPEYANGLRMKSNSGTRKRRKLVLELKL